MEAREPSGGMKPLRSLAYGEVRLRLGIGALEEKRPLDGARWVKLAASNDHPGGLKELAAGYRAGVGGLEQSECMETSMLRRAAEIGDKEAQYRCEFMDWGDARFTRS